MSCPKCNEKALRPFKYEEGTSFAGDWFNEIRCENCGYRECHECHKEMHGDERAAFGCKGNVHPIVTYL